MSFSPDPSLLLPRLRKNATALDGETRGAAFENDKNSIGVDTRYSGNGGGDFRGKTSGFGIWMPLAYPTADEHRARRDNVGVETVLGRLMKGNVHVGAGGVVDL